MTTILRPRRTEEFFLYEVDSLSRLPVYEAVDYDRPVRAIIVIPPQEIPLRHRTWRHRFFSSGLMATPQRTLIFYGTQIVIVTGDANSPPGTVVIPIEHLIRLDLTSILLFASLCFTWMFEESVRSAEVEFNAVGWRNLGKHLNWLRFQMVQDYPPIQNAVPLPCLPDDFPLKFRNYLTLSLLPGECIFTAVYQPALRRFHMSVSPGRALAITDHYLIVVEEEQPGQWTTAYGMTVSYYPHHVLNISTAIPLTPADLIALETEFRKIAA